MENYFDEIIGLAHFQMEIVIYDNFLFIIMNILARLTIHIQYPYVTHVISLNRRTLTNIVYFWSIEQPIYQSLQRYNNDQIEYELIQYSVDILENYYFVYV